MKILAYIAGILILTVFCVFGFIFSSFGNSMIASYAQNLAKQKAGIELSFDKFELGISKADINAKVNNEISASINGDFSVFSQNMDLTYEINASDLKSANLKLTQPIALSGKIKGKFNNFDANGAGEALGSSINFLANIKEYKPLSLQLNAKQLKIDEILALVKQPIYASGRIDITSNITEQNDMPNGMAEILIYDAVANNALISRDFNVSLPKNFTFKGAANAQIANWITNVKSTLITPIATANTTKTVYNIDNKSLNTDFMIEISDLAKLEPIINQKLNGALKANGDLTFSDYKLQNLNAVIDGLGGKIDANLKDGKLLAKIHSVKLEEALKLATQPPYATANINATATIENLNDAKNIKGNIALTSDGKINKNELKKVANLNLAKDVGFSLNTDVIIAKSIAKFKANLLSELIKLKDVSGEFDIQKQSLSSKFSLLADDLAKFESITQQKLSGAVNLNGDIKVVDKVLSELGIYGSVIGGEINAKFKDQNLNATLKNGSLKDAFLLLAQAPLANAKLNLSANLSSIDPKNLNGDILLSFTNGEAYEKELSKLLEKSFPSGVKFEATSNIKLAKNVADFTTDVSSTLLNLKDTSGKFDINSGNLNAKFNAFIPELSRLKFATGRELKGALNATGDIEKSGENLIANLNSNVFGGTITAKLNNNDLNAILQNFTFKDLTDTLNMQHIYDGIGDGRLNYNLASQKGDFNIDINEGRLVSNGFTNTIKTFSGRDITSEIYKNGYLKGTIDKNLINFKAQMSAQRSDINVTNGTFDTTSQAMNIPVDFKYEKTDAKIAITGTTQDPKYSVSSEYLKGKITKEIDRFLDKKLGKDSNETNSSTTKDAIKGLLKGLF
ncbi:translocation/assembly module TamB domain-containing protein [Campylobacter californiensis]|uniref:hypothetical protein n=1 Tax=Campylobacter californiensis TaxID=1032243 RepID=UPI001475F4D2|nr:hypothetical protein [Campylobacter sp. RM12916]MBE3609010.1 hypothetical protein [Campylobacter sp. RM12916]